LSIGILGSSAGWAQSPPQAAPQAQIDLFRPGAAPQTYLQVEQPTVLAPFELAGGVFVDYANDPLKVVVLNGNNQITGTVSNVVKNAFTTTAMMAVGLPAHIQAGLALPFSSVSGDGPLTLVNGMPAQGTGMSATGLGDARLELKWLAYEQNGLTWGGSPAGSLQVAVAPLFTLPTHGHQALVAEKGVDVWPRVSAMWTSPSGAITAGANLGLLFRTSPQNYYSNSYGQAWTWGLGASYQVIPALAVLGEIAGQNQYSIQLDESPTEIDGALRYAIDFSTWVQAGGGTGVIAGSGSPAWRVFTAVVYSPQFPDRDQDGVPDSADKCIDKPEDRDGYQDEDGCPEPDNDADNIGDGDDLCPNEPEDFDNWQDGDGCPEPDNDLDGVLDASDKCPNVPGDAAHDGCPPNMVDSDGDGVSDAQDKCAGKSEDMDGYKDNDGCPDPDNDKDGILDANDKCPNAAEDFDKYKDDDGCPDPDDDLDGVADKQDKCMIGQQETINGYQDDDGCPDQGGQAKVTFDTQKGRLVTVEDNIQFDPNSGAIADASDDQLKQVALTMLANPEVSMWKILASAGANTSAGDGQKHADAVKAYLVKQGVAKDSLDAQGVQAAVDAVGFVVETIGPIPSDEGQGGTDQGEGNADLPPPDQGPSMDFSTPGDDSSTTSSGGQ
jgi:outer membrane protein OmpA-like peptidoglycan-associated protein